MRFTESNPSKRDIPLPCLPNIRGRVVISRITWHGLPTATECEGMSLTTTDPAPITTSSPMVTSGPTTTLPPNQTSLPMVIGRAPSGPEERTVASIG